MTTRRILEIAAFCTALLVAALAVHAWLASRADQRQLESTLTTQKQIIDAATADQQTSEAQLKDTLAQIDKLKSATQTPEQILRELPKYLPLPEPITMASAATSSVGATAGATSATARAAANQQQGIATSQFPTAADAPRPQNANPKSAKPSNSKSADTLPAAASAAVNQSPGSRLKAFLDFFRDAGKAKPVRSSPPSPVCQPETSASTADPAASVTSPKSSGSNSGRERIPDSAAAADGNFSAGKTNPAASLPVSEDTNDASPKSSDSNSISEHVLNSNGHAGNSDPGRTSQAAVPCLPEGTNDAKARQSTLGVGAPGLKPPADTPPPQLTPEQDASAPKSALGLETHGPGLPADALAAQVAPGLDSTAEIPAADLKPLFDFVQNCRSCDAQLKAATQNQADNSAKILALTKERDAAITAGKGGTFLRRLRRNALWFAAGTAVGITAAITAHAAGLR